ncbi:hypothetical protein IC607_13100 [Cellulomonas sp. JH27-2]|uniref:DUF6069 family protein n=1 Tax=Cellulomonas sp. JH27-2 TaxID=2774139 RepID=UPI0017808B6B|nr:DUF6069 family protein [Cellulomonas sp. JH27-2]MBD8059905.1 hypothetical protein [Cellulomonas sp. JH27-2]
MSVPPDQPPTTRIPAAGRSIPPEPAAPADQPPALQPAQPVYAATPAPDTAPPQPTAVPAPAATRPAIAAGPYWAGVVATALVAALIGVAGTVIFESILDVDLVTQDPFGTDSTMGAYVVGGVATAVVAGALLYALVLSTPKPRAFFGWIMGLGTLVVALLPLTWTDDTETALCSGLVNLLIGIAVWSLLSGVLSRTARMVPAG